MFVGGLTVANEILVVRFATYCLFECGCAYKPRKSYNVEIVFPCRKGLRREQILYFKRSPNFEKGRNLIRIIALVSILPLFCVLATTI